MVESLCATPSPTTQTAANHRQPTTPHPTIVATAPHPETAQTSPVDFCYSLTCTRPQQLSPSRQNLAVFKPMTTDYSVLCTHIMFRRIERNVVQTEWESAAMQASSAARHAPFSDGSCAFWYTGDREWFNRAQKWLGA